MIKVTNFIKLRGGKKKYQITFNKNGKVYKRSFGAAGMSDFTIHKNKERRERYISRHKKDLRTNDPMKPGYLSMYILWNKPSISASLADYKRRLNIYNKTGKFPKEITGSKKLAFGASSIIPYKGTMLDKLPDDIISEYLQKPRSAEKIQKVIRGRNIRKDPRNSMTKRFLKNLLWKINANYESPDYATEMLTDPLGQPWFILNPGRTETSQWLFYAANILQEEDFRKGNLWYSIIEHLINEFVEMNPDENDYSGEVVRNLMISQDNIEVLINRMGGNMDFEEPGWYDDVLYWLQNEYSRNNSFGIKKITKTKIPDNVVNKKLYNTIKNKIRKDVDKKNRRWGAYDSGRLVREYKQKGGKYTGKKGKTDLGRWYKEKWVDACAWPKKKSCGRKTKEKIAYCRPSIKVDSKTPKLVQDLTNSQIKSRCSKKKKNPMKIITKFGYNKICTSCFGNKTNIMFSKLFNGGDININIEKFIKESCKNNFTHKYCQNIFTEFILNIYYTILLKSKISKNRKEKMNKIKKYIPYNFNYVKLPLNKSHHNDIETMLYLLQDHSYGTFRNARLASLIFEFIHNI